MRRIIVAALVTFFIAQHAAADERAFTYSYETSVLPEGALEFEQWLTNQNGKEEGDYSKWAFRSELEYGVTDQYTSALYLNWDSVRSEGVAGVEDSSGTDFKGISWENVYQLLNPHLNPVGLAVYGEYTTDGVDQELEAKLLVSKPLENGLNLVANAIYEMEWEKEDGLTEKEAELKFTAGASYKLCANWAVGLEALYASAYPDGFDLNGREFQSVSVGPNVHYGNQKWWATLTVLPQVWGDGEGSDNNRQLVHDESIEVRLIVGFML